MASSKVPAAVLRQAQGEGSGDYHYYAAKLSKWEVQVCVRAVVGYSGEGIALDFGFKQSTVATLRKRAYAKLNTSTLHELFVMCLNMDKGV